MSDKPKTVQPSEIQQLLRAFHPKYRKRGGKLKWDAFLAKYGISEPIETTYAGFLKMGGELGDRIAKDLAEAETRQMLNRIEHVEAAVAA